MEVGFIGMQGDANHVVLGLPFFKSGLTQVPGYKDIYRASSSMGLNEVVEMDSVSCLRSLAICF